MNIWAHRGCSGRFPENTITSFREAVKYDIAGIELDIQLSKDRKMVVIHDEKVDRTTSGTGYVCDLTADELRSLEIEAPGGETERIPFIEEVFDLMTGPCAMTGMKINIELKNSNVRYEGMEEMILETVKNYGLEKHVIYSSFNPDSVKLMKELDPEIHAGILQTEASECLRLLEETGADAIHPLVHWMDVEDLKNKVSIPVRAWNLAGSEPLYPSAEEIETVDIEKSKADGITDLITTYPELYAEKAETAGERDKVLFFSGIDVNEKNGRIKKTKKRYICNREPERAGKGDRLLWNDPSEYEYKIILYSEEIDPDLIYTYKYDKESNWALYAAEGQSTEWQDGPFDFTRDGFFRLVIRKKDGTAVEGDYPGPAEPALFIVTRKDKDKCVPQFITDEIISVSKRLRKVRKPGDTVLFLVADNHYVTNGNWDDTALSLRLAARECFPDAIVHLGDMTDGLLPAALTKQFASRVIRDMKRACDTVYCCVGNHDTNYFLKNPEIIPKKDCALFYTGREETDYYIDLPDRDLRLIFLDSFDAFEKLKEKRYGYSRHTIRAAKRMIKNMPEGRKAIVFSHSPVLPWMHLYGTGLRNSGRLMKTIGRQMREKDVLCIVHGHNHSDMIVETECLPVVSVGTSKLECFEGNKPAGSVTYGREKGTRTQELWDIMRVSRDGSQIDFIRFGAGEDRHLDIPVRADE